MKKRVLTPIIIFCIGLVNLCLLVIIFKLSGSELSRHIDKLLLIIPLFAGITIALTTRLYFGNSKLNNEIRPKKSLEFRVFLFFLIHIGNILAILLPVLGFIFILIFVYIGGQGP